MLPAGKALVVRDWPRDLSLAVQDVRSVLAVTVIGIATPVTASRGAARVLVRDALCQTLGAVLDQPAASIGLVSRPGEAVTLAPLPASLGRASNLPLGQSLDLSLSHAPGLSIAAICWGASVGVDLMRIEDGVEGDPDWLRVARDYLGPQVTASLQATPAAECPVAFAKAWTRFEASLKCLGLGLTEWTPALGEQLMTCQATTLDFSGGDAGWLAGNGNFAGSIAVRTS